MAVKKSTTKSVSRPTREENAQESVKTGTSTFVFMDETKKILDVSMATGFNCVLFGKGGYGKSEFTMAYLKEHSIDPYVITMGSGMNTDRLFGGIDLKVFNDTGKLEYLVDNSFMNHEIAIFEELFDAPDFILEQLKDILSSGVFRNGGQNFEIKTKVIICCTNKTRDEFAKNNSLKALMERFPLELEVKWNDHNRITYGKLLDATFGGHDPMLTYILEEFAKNGSTISPRIAIKAAEVMDKCGPECLTLVADFNSKPKILKDAIAKFKSIYEIGQLVKEVEELMENFNNITLDNIINVKEATSVNKKIKSALVKMKGIKADDATSVSLSQAIKKFENVHDKNTKNLEVVVKVDPSLNEL